MKPTLQLLFLVCPIFVFGQSPKLVVPIGHAYYITGLAFSPDGQTILTSSVDNKVKLWDRNGRELNTFFTDKTSIDAIAFSSDGQRILTRIINGQILSWELNGKIPRDTLTELPDWPQPGVTISKPLEKRLKQQDQRSPTARIFSPDKQQLLTGYNDGQVKRWDESGRLLGSFPGGHGQVYSLAFSADGQEILAGYKNGTTKLWNIDGRVLQTFSSHSSYVNTVIFSDDGRLILTGNDDNTAKLWDINDKTLHTFAGHQTGVDRVSFSPDGQSLLTFDKDSIAKVWDRYRPSREARDTSWDNHPLQNTSYLAASATGDTVILLDQDNDQIAILRDKQTQEKLHVLSGHTGEISSAIFDPHGQTVLTGSWDNTMKLWNTENGQEIATLIQIDYDDWVVTTPSGLFDASPGAMNLMHYVVFYRGKYEVIGLDQLKARYYEPGLLPKLMGFSDELLRPVEQFEAIKLYPEIEATIQNDLLSINLKNRNGGVGPVNITINGKEVARGVNQLSRRENATRGNRITFKLKPYQKYMFRHPDSINIIGITAHNEPGWLKSPTYNLSYTLPPQAKGHANSIGNTDWLGRLDPKLYVVSIGTSNYKGIKMDLQYADQDATMMARALQSVGTALFTNGDSLEIHCLSTASADSTGLEDTPISWQFAQKSNIKATFDAVRNKAKAEDIIVVYLSGHGVTRGGADQPQFYYLTQNVASEEDLADPATLREYTISSEELTKWINDIPALKQVLIIDACNSGQVVANLMGSTKTLNSSQIRALDRMKDRTGMFVLSGSASDKVSYEAGEYGQGLLTYALLQGMLGVATRKDSKGKEVIDVMKLFQYARDEVPKLATSINGIQTPMLGFPNQGASFDIGILDEKAKAGILIGNKKPVMIKNVFMNKQTFLDELKLVELLETNLREETEKGSDADLIYVDVYDYPGAYSLRGMYEVVNDMIKIEVKLFKDQKEPITLDIQPTDDPKRLVKSIVRKMKTMIAKQEN